MRSMLEELGATPDFPRAEGRMHAVATALGRYATPRIHIGGALTAHGKRIRLANRSGRGQSEIIALAVRVSDTQFAVRGYGDTRAANSPPCTTAPTYPAGQSLSKPRSRSGELYA